jgi:RNA-directed DNA polymerase
MLGGFPAKGMIAGWLKAGIFEAGKGFAPTGEGTPQGGIISPLLLNIALHGLEEAAGVRYHTGNYSGTVRPGWPALTRYADDLVGPRTVIRPISLTWFTAPGKPEWL